MGWITGIVSAIVGGGAFIAYKTGFDDVIYRTIMNWLADVFVYIIAKSIDFFIVSLEFLPEFHLEDYQSSVAYTVSVLSLANTIFPILEFVSLIGGVCAFYMFLIGIRIIFKIVPGLGG